MTESSRPRSRPRSRKPAKRVLKGTVKPHQLHFVGVSPHVHAFFARVAEDNGLKRNEVLELLVRNWEANPPFLRK